MSPNLANIRVDFAHNFEFLRLFLLLFGKYVIHCKQIIFALQTSGKSTSIEGQDFVPTLYLKLGFEKMLFNHIRHVLRKRSSDFEKIKKNDFRR